MIIFFCIAVFCRHNETKLNSLTIFFEIGSNPKKYDTVIFNLLPLLHRRQQQQQLQPEQQEKQ